jgi:hypothetical protein
MWTIMERTILPPTRQDEGAGVRETACFLQACSAASTKLKRFVRPQQLGTDLFDRPKHSLYRVNDCFSHLTHLVLTLCGHPYRYALQVAEFLKSAAKLQCLLIAFTPSSDRLLGLLNDTTWPYLSEVGLHSMSFSEPDLIGFLFRHKNSLRRVTLRSLELKCGSWPTIWKFIEDEMSLDTLNVCGKLKSPGATWNFDMTGNCMPCQRRRPSP